MRKQEYKPRLSRLERFMKKVEIQDNGCWNWSGTTVKNRCGMLYGNFKWNTDYYDQKVERANRASYMLFKGEIEEGLVVRHKCDNSLCVNPEHLELGTQKDNKKDSIDKGRYSFGEGHGGHRNILTEEQVLEIIERCKNGESPTKIAPEYNVKRETIFGIKHNRIWKHIPR